MESSLITVVIPCFNQAGFLDEAVESVLHQTYARREIIVVDDGSTDETSAVAVKYREVRLIRQANQGLAAARNRGLAEAQGKYVVFLDADDRLRPHALEFGLRCLLAHPDAAFAYGRYLNISADGTPLSPSTRPCVKDEHYLQLLRANYIGMHAAVIYRREVLAVVGGFDERLRACEDYDLYFRVTRQFPACCHSEIVAEYRQHDANMTRNLALMVKKVLDVLNSQWKYVKGNRHYEEAFRVGVKFWQGYFGEQLLDEVIAHLRARADWRNTLRGLYVLTQYYPQGMLKRIVKRARRTRNTLPGNKVLTK
jgi:glycosyltransferase involved in cell wall biosynthesis